MVRCRRLVAVSAVMLLVLVTMGLAGASSTRAATDTSVSIVDFGFSDATITVEAGSTVTWSNDGAVTHTVTADDGEFDSGDMVTGDTFSITFDTPGTFGYHCAFHPDMIGTVIVTEASDGGDDGGTADDTTDLPDTGSGTSGQMPETNFILLLVAVFAFAGATMLIRTMKR